MNKESGQICDCTIRHVSDGGFVLDGVCPLDFGWETCLFLVLVASEDVEGDVVKTVDEEFWNLI